MPVATSHSDQTERMGMDVREFIRLLEAVGAPLPHLNQPRPHRLRRGLDRDRVRLLLRIRYKLVTGEYQRALFGG
jgi:hypothetical protein